MNYPNLRLLVASLLAACIYGIPFDVNPFNNPKIGEKYALYHCHKERTCTSGGDKVCAFDEWQPHLAIFEDMCVFHKTNCKKMGFYKIVEMNVCFTQTLYEKLSNTTLPTTKTGFPADAFIGKQGNKKTAIPIKERLRNLPSWVKVLLGEQFDMPYRETFKGTAAKLI